MKKRMATRLSFKKRQQLRKQHQIKKNRIECCQSKKKHFNRKNWVVLLGVFLLFVIFFLLGFNRAFAVRLATQGAIYPIVELDLLIGIQAFLLEKEASGELTELKKEWVKRTVAHVLRPQSVQGVSDLPKNAIPTIRRFDPSIVIQQDITTLSHAQRLVLASKGERMNPLTVAPFKELLLFINGDNALQLNWVKQVLNQEAIESDSEKVTVKNMTESIPLKIALPVKIILVNGDIKQVSETLQHRVYFDQSGALCQRFDIHHTPTRVFQRHNGNFYFPELIIEEVSIG